MRALAALLLMLALIWPALAPAQAPLVDAADLPAEDATEAEDQGWLTRRLQDLLSDAGRTVRIEGFSGALSSRASIARLSIADDEGVWLTLNDVVIDWSRRALLRGRVSVSELSAAEIVLERLPQGGAGAGTPAPEAGGFALPDLPVSVEIGRIAAERLVLGEALLGQPAELSLSGSLSLVDGRGEIALAAERLEAEGSFDLAAVYDGGAGRLDLDLALDEPAEGLAATLLGLPGHPPLRLTLKGAGPLDDFTADLALATEGQERLAGTLTLTGAEDGARLFRADVAGDIAPLFLPDYAAFFGNSVTLELAGRRHADGALDLERLHLEAAALALDGQVAIGADGLPQLIRLDGTIADPAGGAVLLPLPGPPTRIERAALAAAFDAAQGEDWTATARVAGLERQDFTLAEALLEGTGRIAAGAITAELTLAATGLGHADPAIAAALGRRLDGAARLTQQAGGPLELTGVRLDGAGYGAGLEGLLRLGAEGIAAEGRATLRLDDLAVLSGLAGRPLSGALEARIEGRAEPLAGTFDLRLEADTRDLGLGQPIADRLLAGAGRLTLDARRDETGTLIRDFALRTPQGEASATGALRSAGSALDFTAGLRDAALLDPALSGALSASGRVGMQGDSVSLTARADGQGGLSALLDATLADPAGARRLAGRAEAVLPDLWLLSPLAGRDLGGALKVTAEGEVALAARGFDGRVRGQVTDARTGIAPLDAVLAGQTAFDIAASLPKGGEVVSLRTLSLDGRNLTLRASGDLGLTQADLNLTARLARAEVLDPALSGPVTATGQVSRSGATGALTFDLDGAGARARADLRLSHLDSAQRVEGQVALDLPDLRALGRLAGRTLSGAIDATATGMLELATGAFDGSIEGSASNLRLGQDLADRLMAGRTTFAAAGRRAAGAGLIGIDSLRLDNRQLSLEASGEAANGDSRLDLRARLADVGLVSPELSGPATARGTLTQRGDGVTLDLRAEGPGGAQAAVSGRVALDGSDADLEARGTAPLALADPFTGPGRLRGQVAFDLRLSGPPSLGGLSGTLSTAGARVLVPSQRLTLTGVTADVRLNGGRASVSVDAGVEGGGRVTVRGEVDVAAAGLPASLGVEMRDVAVRQAGLYETSFDGDLRLEGRLANGARIGGQIRLGRTELRIPSSSFSGSNEIPEITHLAEPADVRATRARAGLLDGNGNGNGRGAGPAYPLDLTILAPRQIFLRGRGLDAELGGEIRLGGTSADVIPSGGFQLVRGRLDILGKRLVLDEGQVTLRGDFDPALRLVARAQTGDGVTVIVTVEGRASEPDISFTSSPPLPQDEVLARLFFGRGITQLSALQAAQLASAVAELAGRGGGGIVANLRESFGLDDLDIQTDAEGNARLAVGKYLSENVYTNVKIGANGKAEVTINLDIRPGVTARGTLGAEGDSSLGIFYERDY